MPIPLLASLLITPSPSCPKTSKHAAPASSRCRHPIPRPSKYSFEPARQGLDADISCVQAPPAKGSHAPPSQDAASKALSAVQQGKVPYNSVNLVAVGPGGAGKTTTRRSIMGLKFSAVKESTVGGEQEHLLISLIRGDMVGFKSIQDVKQLERALLHYLHHSQKADADVEKARKLLDLVQNNAGADEARPLSYLVTVVMPTCYWLRWPGYATSLWRTSSA